MTRKSPLAYICSSAYLCSTDWPSFPTKKRRDDAHLWPGFSGNFPRPFTPFKGINPNTIHVNKDERIAQESAIWLSALAGLRKRKMFSRRSIQSFKDYG